ncbi:demethylmenaquinone methyltransferase (plasmid) [Herpetosiphon aurantiacus DSM 785]|uniref:Putative 4-hydroxy-4-methyl-2-oxoglutarate aldolase n=1 Tax=Herpetosiphon aurantiacus (strain ATCC 23779 / DSM 785 / 114-95) TaxID=316274 RepID=A9B8Q2_HERA2|nr:demethylmenaquinone methyltransferase [Herpetosiphon aurantiacus DSM 785]
MIPDDVLKTGFAPLSTALIADACVRLDLPIRAAPATLQALISGSHRVGRAVPVRHYGSVDIFLDVLETTQPGDILVIDNGGRMDEACIGDLVVLEAQAAGLAAIIVWGVHRDTTDLLRIGFPVFSLGRFPVGPVRLDPWDDDATHVAQIGSVAVTRDDLVFADDDGVLVVAAVHGEQVLHTAHALWERERHQALAIHQGITLRDQVQFRAYLARRHTDPSLTFRQHLRQIGGAIEE